MNYKDCYSLLEKYNLLVPIWKYPLELIADQFCSEFKDEYLIIFSVYFSLIDDGNTTVSLNKDVLINKWKTKLDKNRIILEDKQDFNKEEYDSLENTTLEVINNHVDKITMDNLPSLIGKNRIFYIDNGYLYLSKYYYARLGILASLDRLFKKEENKVTTYNYKDISNGITLSYCQEKAVNEGFNKSLIITGGPGTGKTTSILFLLINLLLEKPDIDIYLTAPSGKAASRMQDSISNSLKFLTEDFKKSHEAIINKISKLGSSTIHKLLGVDPSGIGFKYNKNHQFNSNSIFVIDEASMIDICLFNSLLEAIPTGSKVFIMGDKNQLPSVDVGAVFSDLLSKESLKDFIVELDVSKRFEKGSTIYLLAEAINSGSTLPIKDEEWRNYKDFKIYNEYKTYPIYYYSSDSEDSSFKDKIRYIATIWGNEFYKELQKKSMDLDPLDMARLNEVFAISEFSKILCAENEGITGVKSINKLIKSLVIDIDLSKGLNNNYPGQIMMINKNNKNLDLSNGDSGILVTFKDDNTIYFMTKKDSKLISNSTKQIDKIFKLGDYIFYPLRLINNEEIDLAYAISIHKSQGSDYKNILVVLPNKKGHPLLNRQIVYTAVTRTKGATYIISNISRLNEAKDNVLIRDTNIN